jgi:predicted enzyme related to lactoylglutathione lyase
MPEQTALCSIHGDSVDVALKQIRENGGTVLVGKTPVPEFGWFTVFRDPEGNPLGLHGMERSTA